MPTHNSEYNNLVLRKPDDPVNFTVDLPPSKSISNRLLILQALCKERFLIKNSSGSDDTLVLSKVLKEINSKSGKIFDVGAAGTSFRFLTALFSVLPGEYFLTGSERIKQRPIQPLVEALKNSGAEIHYPEKEGFAPLKITGGQLKGGEVTIDGGISSQFISALMLIGPVLEGGLKIRIRGQLVSRPYIVMTMKLMKLFGVEIHWEGNTIDIPASTYSPDNLEINDSGEKYINVEADWTAASYWFAICALSPGSVITLKGLSQQSIQGDSILPALFTFFGVSAEFKNESFVLQYNGRKEERFGFDFSDNPDLAQTIAVVAAALRVPCLLNGLSTLKNKETNRMAAIKKELKKLNVITTEVEGDSLFIDPGILQFPPSLAVSTYKDHRMAMSFAPLALLTDKIIIEEPSVVNKSYPAFWEHLKKAGFTIIPS